MESKIFKQTFDMDLIYKHIVRSITANRDKNILSAITANRAFRGMAGLAVLYPSVLDYIGQAAKDALSALYGALNAILIKVCRGTQDQNQ